MADMRTVGLLQDLRTAKAHRAEVGAEIAVVRRRHAREVTELKHLISGLVKNSHDLKTRVARAQAETQESQQRLEAESAHSKSLSRRLREQEKRGNRLERALANSQVRLERTSAEVEEAATARGADFEAQRAQTARMAERAVAAEKKAAAEVALRVRIEAELRSLREAWEGMEMEVERLSSAAQSRIDKADARIQSSVERAAAAERRCEGRAAEVEELRENLKRRSLELENSLRAKRLLEAELYDKKRLCYEVGLRAQVATSALEHEHAVRKLAERDARLAHLAAVDAGRAFPARTQGLPLCSSAG